MSSHVPRAAAFLSASPLVEGERIKVRGFFTLIIKLPNPHPTLSLGKGEANLLR
jgi:hypothetical protein